MNLPSLYFLSGLLCDEQVWQPQVKALEPYFRITIPDFSGVDSLSDMADQVLHCAPDKFAVVGHSMGGRVALEIINKAPERVTHLVLMSVGAHPVHPEETESRMALLAQAEAQGMALFANTWLHLMSGPAIDTDVKLQNIVKDMAARQSTDEFAAHIAAAAKRENQLLYLPQIKQKVLLMCGEYDEWSPVEQHEAIHQLIPDAQLKVVPDAGHMLTLENPKAVNQNLLDWLTD